MQRHNWRRRIAPPKAHGGDPQAPLAAGCTIEQDLGQLDTREAVGYGVVRLHHERLAPTLEAVNEVHLPERPVAREKGPVDGAAQPAQLGGVTGRRQAVVVEVPGEAYPRHTNPLRSGEPELAEAGALVELGEAPDPPRDHASQLGHRHGVAWLDHHNAGYVHGKAWTLESQKRRLESIQTLCPHA